MPTLTLNTQRTPTKFTTDQSSQSKNTYSGGYTVAQRENNDSIYDTETQKIQGSLVPTGQDIKKEIKSTEPYHDSEYSHELLSDEYVRINMSRFIKQLSEMIENWKKHLPENNHLSDLSQIQDLTERYNKKLNNNANSRILINRLSLLVEDDGWKQFDEDKLDFLLNELKRFKDGIVHRKSISTFSKQLHRADIDLLFD